MGLQLTAALANPNRMVLGAVSGGSSHRVASSLPTWQISSKTLANSFVPKLGPRIDILTG